MMILEYQGWAVGDLIVSEEGRYLVTCNGLHTVIIGNTTLAADIYRENRPAMIHLQRGKRIALFLHINECRCFFLMMILSSSAPHVQNS